MRSGEKKLFQVLSGNCLGNSCLIESLFVYLGINKKVMAEKTGATVKKLYDFNTSGVLEVCIKDNWYRVTSNEFRSFDGKRRITEPVKQPGIGDSFDDIEFRTYDYNGPVYILQTNLEVIRMDTETIVTNPKMPVNQKSLPNNNRI